MTDETTEPENDDDQVIDEITGLADRISHHVNTTHPDEECTPECDLIGIIANTPTPRPDVPGQLPAAKLAAVHTAIGQEIARQAAQAQEPEDAAKPAEPESEQPRRHVVRGGHGRFDKNPDAAHIDAECCRLRARSMSYPQIAEQLGISVSRAYNGVKNGIATIVREPAEAALALELEKLDALERQYLDILGDIHPVLYQGQDTGFTDDGPKMQALAGLLRTSESRRKLLGLDQPAKVNVSGGIAYTLNGVDLKDVT